MNNEALQWMLDHAINSFESEEKRKDKIRERASFMISIGAPSYVAALIYLINNFKEDLICYSNFTLFTLQFFTLQFITSTILLIITITVTSYILLRGFKYARPPSPKKILERINTNKDNTLNKTKKELLNKYIEAVEKNSSQNNRSQKMLLIAQRCFLGALCALIICTPKWVCNFIQNESKPQLAKIVPLVNIA